jgi:hypothetical protein
MVVAGETLQKTRDNPLRKKETRLQKFPLTNQTSNELGDSNPNHKIKIAKHQQKCGQTPKIQQKNNKTPNEATTTTSEIHAPTRDGQFTYSKARVLSQEKTEFH